MSAPTDVERAAYLDVDPDDGTEPTERHASSWTRIRRQLPTGWRWHLDDWLGLVILVACCTLVLVHLQPDLIFRNTTPNGGDLGAHVWWPAYLRDHLLPWKLAGWSPDFYAGFPAGQFYFPVPALAIVGLDLVVPYNIAFKSIVALGPVLVPAGAYVFARGIRAPNPTPAAFAIAITSFLFFTGDPGTTDAAQAIAFNQRIMGGNLASNLAGEFSFTLAIALALFFFGTLATALRTRRHLWLPALLLALCLTSHLVVGIFAGLGALAVWLFHRPIANLGRMLSIGGVGVALSAVWVVPLLATLNYTTNMRYGTLGVDAAGGQHYTDYLFPKYFFEPDGWEPYRWGGYILIAIAAVSAALWVRRSTLVVLVLTALCGLAFRFWADLGTHVWNLRLLSFWYIGVHLLMGIGAAELIRGGGWLVGRGWARAEEGRAAVAAATGEVVPAEDAPAEQVPADALPPLPPATRVRSLAPRERGAALVAMLVLTSVLAIGALKSIDDSKSFLPFWAKWNFSGYENVANETYTASCAAGASPISTVETRNGDVATCVFEDTTEPIKKPFPEYRALLDELEQLPPGRSLWEGGTGVDKYGTPLALMLIPYWTDGRISSMEGVYFEASGTTPYHFETVAALAASGLASNPVRGIPYRDQQSFDIGVRYLQALGVKYFLAHSPVTKEKAGADPRLSLVATSPDLDGADPQGWSIYRVSDTRQVVGLAYEPVVAEGVAPDPEGWEQQVAAPWWWFPDQLDAPIVAEGPSGWRRAEGAAALTTTRRTIDPVRVRDVHTTNDSVSFRVDRTGAPVLVKTSYFPNWKVAGAEGPYRATPNFMVVVPTEKRVTLYYGTSRADRLGFILTLLGVAGLGALVWWGRRARAIARDRRTGMVPASEPGTAGTMPPVDDA